MKNKHALPVLAFMSLLPTVVQADENASLESVLNQNHACSDTIVIRSQALTKDQISSACELLVRQETNFHKLFGTQNKPVADDN
ncbi:collagenase, partial [Shewanella sp. 0m-11]